MLAFSDDVPAANVSLVPKVPPAAGRPLVWTSYQPVPEWITGMGIGTTFEVA